MVRHRGPARRCHRPHSSPGHADEAIVASTSSIIRRDALAARASVPGRAASVIRAFHRVQPRPRAQVASSSGSAARYALPALRIEKRPRNRQIAGRIADARAAEVDDRAELASRCTRRFPAATSPWTHTGRAAPGRREGRLPDGLRRRPRRSCPRGRRSRAGSLRHRRSAVRRERSCAVRAADLRPHRSGCSAPGIGQRVRELAQVGDPLDGRVSPSSQR